MLLVAEVAAAAAVAVVLFAMLDIVVCSTFGTKMGIGAIELDGKPSKWPPKPLAAAAAATVEFTCCCCIVAAGDEDSPPAVDCCVRIFSRFFLANLAISHTIT